MEKLKGKGKKAYKRLKYINVEIGEIIKKLEKLHKFFGEIIESSDFQKIGGKINDLHKQRSMIDEAPKRIEFMSNQLKFYIDFTIVPSEGDDPTDIKGSIIYGANRTLCFKDCLFQENSEKCKLCERINRCDGLEDKPLIQFSVNKTGMIKSRGELEDEWWIKEKEDLVNLHYRALDHIWKDSIDWTNENISP